MVHISYRNRPILFLCFPSETLLRNKMWATIRVVTLEEATQTLDPWARLLETQVLAEGSVSRRLVPGSLGLESVSLLFLFLLRKRKEK